MEEEQKHTTLGKISLLMPIICIILMCIGFSLFSPLPTTSLLLSILGISLVSLLLLIISMVLGVIAYTSQKKDTYGLIGLIVSILFIFMIVPMGASMYVYLTGMSNEYMNTPFIAFNKNTMEKTLVVVSSSSNNLVWSDFNISGDCDASELGGYIKNGDTIRNCAGTIKIIYEPTRTLIGIWSFG